MFSELPECAGWSYPGGAPGCGLTPGHGREVESVNTTLQYLGEFIWQVRTLELKQQVSPHLNNFLDRSALTSSSKELLSTPSTKVSRSLLVFYRSLSAGRWGWCEEVFRLRGNCITHSSRCTKEGARLIFVSSEDDRKVPEFTGFVVYNYNSYSKLKFNLKTERQLLDGC